MSFVFNPSLWFVCRLCRHAFPDVEKLKEHKVQIHLSDCLNTKSIVFEETCLNQESSPAYNYQVQGQEQSIDVENRNSTTRTLRRSQRLKNFSPASKNPCKNLPQSTSTESDLIVTPVEEPIPPFTPRSNEETIDPTKTVIKSEPIDPEPEPEPSPESESDFLTEPVPVDFLEVEHDFPTDCVKQEVVEGDNENNNNLEASDQSPSPDTANYFGSLIPSRIHSSTSAFPKSLQGDCESEGDVYESDVSENSQGESKIDLEIPTTSKKWRGGHGRYKRNFEMGKRKKKMKYSTRSSSRINSVSNSESGSKFDIISRIGFGSNSISNFKTKSTSQSSASSPSLKNIQKPMIRCHICYLPFLRKEVLVQHMKSHSENKVFHCPHCPLSYNYKHLLEEHLEIHGGIDGHQCKKCGAVLPFKNSLLDHQRACHLEDRPFVCKIGECGASYKTEKHLRRHVRRGHRK